MLIYHIDMNSVAFRAETVRKLVRKAAELGYDAILWEVEDKIRWESCPEVVHPDALTKAEFRSILAEAAELGLEAIPLLQTFGHAEYVLSHDEYKSMRELPDRYDCYCVSKPETRDFLKRLLHEYLELFGSVRYFHLGGDEAYSFGKCPVCSKRIRMELYAEHLMAVSEELREKGIRPCCWHDMILDNPDPSSVGLIPRDFMIFLWRYGTNEANIGQCEKTLNLLLSLGFDVIPCGAVQSWGEDPFVGSFRRHADNCGTLAHLARKHDLPGFCVTSWSIRGAPKGLQVSIMDFAARCYCDASQSPLETVRHKIRERYLGVAEIQYIHDLMVYPVGMAFFTSIGWTGGKDSLPPTKERAERFLDKNDKDIVEMRRKMEKELPGALERFRTARKELCLIPSRTPIVSLLLQGAELKDVFLRCMLDVLEGRPIRRSTVEAARSSTEAFYGKEQRKVSARRFSEIVWGVLLHLAE